MDEISSLTHDKEKNEKDYSDFILEFCDEIANLTEEQYQNERKYFTSFDEELDKFAKHLSKKITNNKIENDVD